MWDPFWIPVKLARYLPQLEYAPAGMDDEEAAASDEATYPDYASKDTHPSDCCCCGCAHIGNLIVVCEAPQQAGRPRSLWCVVGPYWSMMLCCTTPLILVPSGAAVMFISSRVHPALTVAFAAAALFVLCSLWKTATSNPGLVVRRTRDPNEGKEVWETSRSWRREVGKVETGKALGCVAAESQRALAASRFS